MQFREDIQGLRALAFLFVLFFHMNSAWLPGGFLGVDLFFVISGYLMTTITTSEIAKGKFSFANFYAKRLKRLLPAYLFFLFIACGVGSWVYLFTDLSKLQKSLQSAIGFYSNYYFASGESYFGAKLSENPLLHTWSLSVEMQFYLILPFLVFFFKDYLKPLFFMICTVLIGYSSYELLYGDNASDMYFSLWSRIPEFLIGALFALWFKNGIPLKNTYANLLGWGSLLGLVACLFLINETSVFPGALAVLPCVLGANLLAIKSTSLSRFLSYPLLVKIGEWSYSLYLWHWAVLAFLRYNADTYELSPFELVTAVLITFVGALFSYYLVEKPLRYLSTKKLAIGLIPLIIFFVFTVKNLNKYLDYKKLPDQYVLPNFGITSHNVGKVQRLGDRSRHDSILLIGDSHALSMKPFLDALGKKHGFSYETATNDGIPALPEVKREEMMPSDINFYKNSRRLVGLTSKLIDRNKIIFINSTSFVRYPSLEHAVEALCQRLRPDQKLVVVRSFPTLTRNPVRINRDIIKHSNKTINLNLKLDNKEFIEGLTKKYDQVYMYDLTKSAIFKTPGYINDTVSYYNATHLNTFGALKMSEDLDKDFMKFFSSIK